LKIQFEKSAFEEFNEWVVDDKKIHKKIIELIKDIIRNGNEGIGKPEALKHKYSGLWSRRITDEHRLIYNIENDVCTIYSLKGHYE
jgi:toxin YoeB